MKIGICSLGCKVNAYESEYILSLFKDRNYIIASFDDDCDIYIINTCTVTNNSDSKSRKMINHIKTNHPNSCLVVCGCFIESAKDYSYDGIDIIIGNYNKSKIVDYVEEYFKNKKQVISDIKINDQIKRNNIIKFEDMQIKHFEDHTRAFVKIQDGCDNFCSYCIIPYVRGKCRSKKPEKVISEITTLVTNGYNEIVLTGIHTGNYGVDINTNFSNILEKILEIPNLKRLRISSIEITELDNKFLKLLKNPILCNHLHIPLQSGCAKTLKAMNRKYNKEYFLNMVNKIRSVRSDISLTTDVIVGFPDETDNDFEESIAFIKQIGFSKVHVFPYSKRNGTVAACMKNQIDRNTKKIRTKDLINISNNLEEKYCDKFVGQELDCLIEKYENGYSYGHTSNYLYLKIPKKYLSNTIQPIVITKDIIIIK